MTVKEYDRINEEIRFPSALDDIVGDDPACEAIAFGMGILIGFANQSVRLPIAFAKGYRAKQDIATFEGQF